MGLSRFPLRFNWRQFVAALGLLLAPAMLSAAESIKDGAKKAGHAIGSTAREVKEGATDAGKEVGKGAKKVGKAVGGVAKEGVEAAKEGGREFKRAVSGK